jgi:multidrug efflux pump subunit AcrA (membrane-fusion protein)
VFVVEGEAGKMLAQLRTIRLGQFAGSRITVLAGLKEGEQVVTGGKQNLVDGALIRVVK